ncbi:MBL fold metallo-hydrolase [Allobacillus sp. GCM10007491]|uniref:MBL fold metallo-hydrolase n=1 Tax=Allobacillus saliphilus TaxID=2912308 RepID=A0A941CW82_9BACI|nr:MBL fold metallo-hydrolase [Allobacillus saliphilus]MBR7553320.1 MBL fold metallo-hydrolase [Allobacillus saliphilus]
MINHSIHQITVTTPYAVGDVHMYVYKGESVSLIDAGVNTDEAWDQLVKGLKEINLQPSDIEQIILTHHHPDHIGLTGRFEHEPIVYGHRLVEPWLNQSDRFFEGYRDFFNDLYEKWDVPQRFRNIEKTIAVTKKFSSKSKLHHYLSEGDIIEGIPGMRVIETPGHAQSHLSFWDETNRQMIVGDVLLKHISSNPLLEPPENKGDARPKPLLEYRKSLAKLLEYDVEQFLPGHGNPFRGHKELIERRLERQAKRAENVLVYLKEKGPLTPYEICTWLFARQYESQFGLTMSETIGQLDYLESIGAVNNVESNGVSYYAPTMTHQK